MTAGVCPLPHRHEPERPREAAHGVIVCRPCLEQTRQAVAELPAQHDALGRMLATGGSGTGPKVSGTKEKRLPIRGEVADHREHITRTLVSWVMLVAEERGDAPSCRPIATETAAWLEVRHEYALAQMWGDEYASELLALRHRALALLNPSGRRRIAQVGPCVTVENDQTCPGVLSASVAPSDALLPSSVDCDVCGASWTADEWLRLGRIIHGERRMDPDGVARLIGRMSA